MDDVGCRKMGWLDDWIGIGRVVPLKAGDLKLEIGLRVTSCGLRVAGQCLFGFSINNQQS